MQAPFSRDRHAESPSWESVPSGSEYGGGGSDFRVQRAAVGRDSQAGEIDRRELVAEVLE